MTASVRSLLATGFAILALGLVADLVIHVGGSAGAHHASAATAVHLLVLVGMVLTLAAVVLALWRRPGSQGGI